MHRLHEPELSIESQKYFLLQSVSFPLQPHFEFKIDERLKQEVKQPDQLLLEDELIKKAQADPASFKPLYEAYYNRRVELIILYHQ